VDRFSIWFDEDAKSFVAVMAGEFDGDIKLIGFKFVVEPESSPVVRRSDDLPVLH